MPVFDATALEGLLDVYRPVWAMWERANEGSLVIFIPTLAIVEVGERRNVTAGEWEALLWPSAVEVMPLGVSAAVEIGSWPGLLSAKHAAWEAQVLDRPVVTRRADLYEPGFVQLLVV